MTSPNTATSNASAGSNSNLTDPFQNRGSSDDSDRAFYAERAEYFKSHYDVMTGLRIAATLGGFFLLVLITLLYKSKCKKSSREGTPTPRMEADLALLSDAINEDSHPHHPPLFHSYRKSPIECDFENDLCAVSLGHGFQHGLPPSPQVLLTQPNDSSQSSNESELSLSSYRGRESSVSSGGIGPPPLSPITPGRGKIRRKRKMNWLQQNIDIHVIQPTPTISPSGSATFYHPPPPLLRKHHHSPRQPSRAGIRDLTLHRASDSDAVDMSMSGGASSSICNPLFFLHAESLNLRYVDDTSSENIPTRASDLDDEEGADIQSLGSDSVFNFQSKVCEFEDGDGEADEDGDQCRITLTHAQVHHRDSYCSSEFESINDYLESQRRRSSSTQTTFSDLRQMVGFVLPGTGNAKLISPPTSKSNQTAVLNANGNNPLSGGQRSALPSNYYLSRTTTANSTHTNIQSPIISTSPPALNVNIAGGKTSHTTTNAHHPLGSGSTNARKKSGSDSREKLTTFNQIQKENRKSE